MYIQCVQEKIPMFDIFSSKSRNSDYYLRTITFVTFVITDNEISFKGFP